MSAVVNHETVADLRARLLSNARDILTFRQVGDTLANRELAPMELRRAYRDSIEALEAENVAIAKQITERHRFPADEGDGWKQGKTDSQDAR